MRKIFISYTGSDSSVLQDIEKYLIAFNSYENVEIFTDKKLKAGTNWDIILRKEIENADAILIIISASYLSNKYLFDSELSHILSQAKNGKKYIKGIVVSSCDWLNSPISQIPIVDLSQSKSKGKDYFKIVNEIKEYFRRLNSHIQYALNLIRQTAETKAKRLDLGFCGLTDLEKEVPELFELEWLEELVLGNTYWDKEKKETIRERNTGVENSFHTHPQSLKSLEKLKKLNYLSLSNTQIGIEGAKNIAQLKYLSKLYLSGNKIGDEGAKAIAKLKSLTELSLGKNQISDSGAKAIAKLSNLTQLHLWGNQIGDEGVYAIAQLKKLTIIDLRYNKITQVISLALMRSLETINLRENPIQDCPSDIWETNDIQQIRAYFLSKNSPKEDKSVNEENEAFSNITARNMSHDIGSHKKNLVETTSEIRKRDVKLILLGNSNTGKSSLFHYLQTGEFLNERNSTHGMNVVRWTPDADRFPELKDITVSVWDFGGQEYYHEAYKLFLSTNAVYVVMWCSDSDVNGIRKTKLFDSDLIETPLAHFEKKYWLDTVKFYSGKQENEPLLLVQCKTDLQGNNKKRISQDLHEKYNIKESFHISLKEGCNTENKKEQMLLQLFTAELSHQLLQVADKVSVNENWEKIRQEILKLHTNKKSIHFSKSLRNNSWLRLKDFYTICNRIIDTELNDDEKYTIPRWLDRGGVTVFFNNHSVLGDRIFLNPKSMTEQIYRRLGKEVHAKNGILALEKDEIFKSLLLDLGLIFKHPEDKDDTIFLAPQYLPETHAIEDLFKIASNKAWQTSIWIKLPIFFYKKVLNGLIFHYANKNNAEIRYFWKHGIMFIKNDLRVLVKGLFPDENSNQSELLISVENGNNKSKLEKEVFDIILEQLGYSNSVIENVNNGNATDIMRTSNKLKRILRVDSNTIENNISIVDESKTDEPINNNSTEIDLLISRDRKHYVALTTLLKTIDKGTVSFVSDEIDNSIPISLFSSILPLSNIIQTKKVFLSYSHQNTHWLNRLRVHLSGLKHSKLIETWTDQEILPGEKWDEKIKKQIENSDLFILLLSADFMASNYIWKDEMPSIKAKIEKHGGKAIMILTEPFDIGAVADISQYELIPKDDKEKLTALSLWQNQEEALSRVAEKIRGLIGGNSY